jgi:hypothetical protein
MTARHSLRLIFGVLLLSLLWIARSAAIDLKEIDLLAATAVSPKFSVKDATLEQAVREFFRSAGHKEFGDGISIHGPEEARVTLELKNVGLRELLWHLSALSGCYGARFRSWSPPVINVHFDPITQIDDTGIMVHLYSYPLSQKGAARLGLKPGMTSGESSRILRRYGLSFLESDKFAAWWNAETGILSVRAPRGETMAGAVARLANDGFRLVKDTN